jgi:uncharacterized alpha/beta hydrolase family protein
MARSQHNKDLLPTVDEINSATDAGTDSLFDSSDDETEITGDADTDDDEEHPVINIEFENEEKKADNRSKSERI